MQKIQNTNRFWLKIVIACVILALMFNFLSIGLGLLLSTIIGGFVNLILFVVLDVFVAAILFAVDILVFLVVDVFVAALLMIVDVFVYLLLGGLAIAGYAALAAVVIVPLALIYKYTQNHNHSGDADYK